MNSVVGVGQESERIRVLLVDDSPMALLLIRRTLAQDPQIEVVGTAEDGAEGLRLVHELQPDVVSTDLFMPVMDGLELTRRIMAESPRPVLVCSTAVQADNTINIFDLLQAGALDVFPKPRTGLDQGDLSGLVRKIRVLAGVKVFRSRSARSHQGASAILERVTRPQIVVVGVSTGGPRALQHLFGSLPAEFPLPILCVQHISGEFAEGLVNWLSGQSALTVRFARAGESFQPGTIYFPPPGQNLTVGTERDAVLLAIDEREVGPSVDATMLSVAATYGAGSVGILLTGMGSDGAKGMVAISQAGGMTIAQNAETSVIFGMPERAIAQGGAQRVLSLNDIAPTLVRLAHASRAGSTPGGMGPRTTVPGT
jgi:two-component system chemotaxis response regulator CheB